MIVDCHCHAGRGDRLTGPWDDAPLGRYLPRAERAGIDRTVLFPAFHRDYAAANRGVARIVAARPDRFLGFAFVHADRDAGRIAGLVRTAVCAYGFVGIKVHRHDAPITREVCDAARYFRLPVLYDPMGEVAVAELLAEHYPDVPFVLPHLGSFADDWHAQLALVDHLVRHPNIHTDTSGVRRFDLLAEAVRRAGPEKVLFGSDGPWLHPGVELAKVRALGLGAEEEGWVLSGNLLALVGGERHGPRRAGVTVPVTPRVRRPAASSYRSPFRGRRRGGAGAPGR
ncbi:amidohydrolase family protein [Streptomyces sp. NPDC056361]|uniref:amidohydrolase family protein n=1 Tax=Streptomyces sp. NPDC056361 TaxID=3345795 RepID=UPI0035DA7AAA